MIPPPVAVDLTDDPLYTTNHLKRNNSSTDTTQPMLDTSLLIGHSTGNHNLSIGTINVNGLKGHNLTGEQCNHHS